MDDGKPNANSDEAKLGKALQDDAQQMLSDLHFTRLERLSAAGINMLGIGVLVGTLATGLIRKSNPRID